jgi:hypothetical protein
VLTPEQKWPTFCQPLEPVSQEYIDELARLVQDSGVLQEQLTLF